MSIGSERIRNEPVITAASISSMVAALLVLCEFCRIGPKKLQPWRVSLAQPVSPARST